MTGTRIRHLDDMSPFRGIEDIDEFLHLLGEPTWLFIPGKDSTTRRVIITLLHGNEPSGAIATLRLIREEFTPAVDTWILIASVKTALTHPLFSHRMLKGNPDLNRCFSKHLGKQDTSVHHLAVDIAADIQYIQPESVIDVHNTSGAGPGFCVVPSSSKYIDILESFANLFTQTLVLTDIHLGALMEHDFGGPIITVECGGNRDEASHELAYQGFKKYLLLEDFSVLPQVNKFTTYRHPLRLEIKEGYYLNYASEHQLGSDLTLKHEIEQLNFGTTLPNQNLGWLGPEGLHGLQVVDTDGVDRIDEYFVNIDDELHAKTPLHLFMVTKNLEIAVSDCLFYFCEV